MTVKVIIDENTNYKTKKYNGECLTFESTGWWGNGPVSFRREVFDNPDYGYDNWSMNTVSGGQNKVDVLVQIRELREMLNVAEARILETRAIEQETDGMELVG
ncbi:MAG: hypothetical protein CL855_01995 [Cryomorphaceae bacterium]|jgi:hypothetical protein|nr:hypothetical protein [Cryomorphaceae bacterium]